MAMGSAEGLPKNHTRLCQASAEHFQQCVPAFDLAEC
jgi:hypothetical protein